MIRPDITKEEFIEIVNSSSGPAMVQVMAKVSYDCTPMQLYATLQDREYSYLLESVEKEKRHARYSFVGAFPDVVFKVNGRNISLEHDSHPMLMESIRAELEGVCEITSMSDTATKATLRAGNDVLDALRAVVPTAYGTTLLNARRFDRQTFLGGAIGYNGYDLVYDCWLDIERSCPVEIADMQFIITTKSFVFDHLTHDIHIVSTPLIDINKGDDPGLVYEKYIEEMENMEDLLQKAAGLELIPHCADNSADNLPGANCDLDYEGYRKRVLKAKQHIIDGDIFQVVLSRKYSLPIKQTPLELYQTLRGINPSPYMYLFNFRDVSIVGASPETLMTVHKRTLITNPIAGTCPRGKDAQEDDKLARALLADEKECAEHVMLVDLGRNDVRMVSKSGSVKVYDYMKVVKYSHVQHIESTVCGTLRDECDQFDATRAIFPAGTLSGAPKIRAMEIIDDLEPASRGIYGGGVGYYSWNGDADLAIVIRTVIMKGGMAYIQAGAGIVADSDPEYEFNETQRKMAAMISAVGGIK